MINLKSIGLVVLAVLLTFLKVDACSCALASFENALKFSDEIFEGKVIKVEKLEYTHTVDIVEKIYFEIDRQWKGNDTSQLIVEVDNLCPYGFDIGHTYLVYAYRYEKTEGEDLLTTWACSRTTDKPANLSEYYGHYVDDVKQLNKIFFGIETNEDTLVNEKEVVERKIDKVDELKAIFASKDKITIPDNLWLLGGVCLMIIFIFNVRLET